MTLKREESELKKTDSRPEAQWLKAPATLA